ncbi:MAG: rod shape-determining protein MreD [Clostridia bacterium]|nr:rod shape-determining protein MreD [Clostridia bacterium]
MAFSDGLIFTIGILAFFLIAFLWGLCRGLAKTRIRGILIVGSAVAAVLSTVLLKQFITTEQFVSDVVMPVLSYFLKDAEQVNMIASFLGVSQTLNDVLLGSIGSLIAPLLCVAFFLIYSIITWIVFAIVTLCTSSALKRQNSKSHFKPIRVLIWALVQTLVVAAIYMIPVSVYSRALSTVLNEMAQADMMDNSSEELDLVKDVLYPIDNNPITVAYRSAGGDALCNLVTDFSVKGTPTHLNDEVGAVTSFSCKVYRLTKTKLANMDDREAQLMEEIAESIEDSTLLSAIAGEVVYTAADNWKSDKEFLGVSRPHVDDLFDPLISTLVDIFHQDSQNIPQLQDDLHTLADVISVLSKHDILANLSKPEVLIDKMSGGTAINEMTDVLNANESMKVLIPEVTNLGVRAIANTLGLSPEEAKLHDEFMSEIANTLNDVKHMEDREAQETLINDRLEAEFVKSGLEVDRETIESYSGSMIDDLLTKMDEDQDLTESDMQAFFITYALEEIQKQKEAGNEDFKDFEGIEDYENLIPKTQS